VNWVARLPLPRADVPLIAAGFALTSLLALAATQVGEGLSLALIVVLTLFFTIVTAFVVVPYLAVALTMLGSLTLLPALLIASVDRSRADDGEVAAEGERDRMKHLADLPLPRCAAIGFRQPHGYARKGVPHRAGAPLALVRIRDEHERLRRRPGRRSDCRPQRHAELSADFAQVLSCGVTKRHHRGTTDDSEIFDLCQTR